MRELYVGYSGVYCAGVPQSSACFQGLLLPTPFLTCLLCQVSFSACISTFLSCVLSAMAEQDVENELLDYDEDEEPQAPQESTPAPPKKDVKGSYVSIHSSGFRDFLLKPELLRAIVDCGFEHPSEGMLSLPAIPSSKS